MGNELKNRKDRKMQKNLTQVKCVVNSKEINLSCDADCTTIELKEGLFQFFKHIGQIEDAYAAKLKEEQEKPVEIMDDSKVEMVEE
jgi:hypothetical protein